MKDYGKYYLKSYIIVHVIFLLLAMIVYRRADINYTFMRLEVGALIITAIASLAVWFFRLEKGSSLFNTIIGYLILIPGIFVLRNTFGNYLFKFSWLIYLVIVFVGIIYGVAVFVVSKKYKKEVDDLNELLQKDSQENEK